MFLKQVYTLIKPFTPYLFWGLICLVTSLLLMEQRGLTVSFPHLDKIIHATLFAALTFTGYLAYSKFQPWVYSGLICYGVLTEVLQGILTVTRYASFYDWLADATGILIGALLIKMFNMYAKTQSTYVS